VAIPTAEAELSKPKDDVAFGPEKAPAGAKEEPTVSNDKALKQEAALDKAVLEFVASFKARTGEETTPEKVKAAYKFDPDVKAAIDAIVSKTKV
jgi:hypothetical protein